ncbi:MAG TPA: hypothetical protein VMR70_03705 [Flavisolibacter sp.]|nr:hypothetical protein [Flavisolibacter sp.]
MEPSSFLANWIPLRRQSSATGLSCDWLHVAEKRFTEPFFEETIAKCRYANQHRRYKVVSSLDSLLLWSKDMDAIPVTAIIFHVSRCGSTLFSQLLAADEKNIALSEVPFLDDMLRLPYQQKNVSTKEAESYFQAALAFYGQRRLEEQERLFIKADCWHLHFYEQLRQLFPSVPFFLLYREPMAVLQSQQRQRGLQSVPGLIEAGLLGLTEEQSRDTNLDRYMSNVLTGFFQKMIGIAEKDPLAIPLNYDGGISNHVKRLYQQLGLPLDKNLEDTFIERSRFHAKRPQQSFDELQKSQNIPAYARRAMALYQQLDQLTKTRFST